MNVNVSEHNGDTVIYVGEGRKSQKSIFKEGNIYKKISKNVYFNNGEFLECVGFHNKVAYFTTQRLRSIHQREKVRGVSPLAGIPLEIGEVLELVDQKEIKRKLLKLNIQQVKDTCSLVDTQIARNKETQEQLKRDEQSLMESKVMGLQKLKELQLELENL